MARNPIFPNYWWYAIAKRHLARQEFDEAITAIEKVAQPDFWIFQMASAYIYAHAGRINDAEQAIKALLELSPDMTVQKGADLYIRYNFEPSFVALVIDGLRLAGLREGGDEDT
jgi:tetratricopeptide (TPR) repeat protein